MNLRTISNVLINRMREPSSWSGVAVILTVLGLSNAEADAVTNLLAVAAAGLGVFLREQGSDAL